MTAPRLKPYFSLLPSIKPPLYSVMSVIHTQSELLGMCPHQPVSADEEVPVDHDSDCEDYPDSSLRRHVIAGTATGTLLSLAGCAGLFETDQDDGPDNFVDDTEDEDSESFDVEFLRAGQTLEISSEETILTAGQEADIEFTDDDSLCGVGACGNCTSRVAGDATEVVTISDDQQALDEQDNAEGRFLPCVSHPQASFAIDERPDKAGDPLSE